MLTCFDVADYFLSKTDEEAGDVISNLKLQKLVYYAQGFTLAVTGKPLFNEEIEAWQHGPVVPDLYHKYKDHGAYGIPAPTNVDFSKFSSEIKEILDEGHKQAIDIIKSHRETHKIIAEALLKYETLNEKQILSLFKTGKMPENDENEFPSESKASTYEEAKAAMEKKDQQREETENKDDKEDIHPLPDDHKNIDDIPLNPPSEKNDSEDHSSDENKDD